MNVIGLGFGMKTQTLLATIVIIRLLRNYIVDLSVYEAIFFKFSGSTRGLCPNRICDTDKDIEHVTELIEDYVGLRFPNRIAIKAE
jgi:hypothetical protein